jgi:hypothetical protein
MSLHNARRNRHAEPSSFRLCGKERLEDSLLLLGG